MTSMVKIGLKGEPLQKRLSYSLPVWVTTEDALEILQASYWSEIGLTLPTSKQEPLGLELVKTGAT